MKESKSLCRGTSCRTVDRFLDELNTTLMCTRHANTDGEDYFRLHYQPANFAAVRDPFILFLRRYKFRMSIERSSLWQFLGEDSEFTALSLDVFSFSLALELPVSNTNQASYFSGLLVGLGWRNRNHTARWLNVPLRIRLVEGPALSDKCTCRDLLWACLVGAKKAAALNRFYCVNRCWGRFRGSPVFPDGLSSVRSVSA